jgi:hypothetical protein
MWMTVVSAEGLGDLVKVDCVEQSFVFYPTNAAWGYSCAEASHAAMQGF